jgi:hypothetical protein
MAPVSFEQYGNQLREKGIYAFAMDRTFAGDLKRPTGYMELSSYQTETTPDLFKFFPNPGWEPTPGRDPDVAVAIVLGLSGLICLDVDVKKYPEQIQGMTAQEVRKFTQSLVPASWWNSGCYKQWTKSNGVHLVWRLPEGEDFTGKSEASTPQGLYKDISRVFKLENLQPVEGQYPPVPNRIANNELRTIWRGAIISGLRSYTAKVVYERVSFDTYANTGKEGKQTYRSI